MTQLPPRWILHVDMDAFYASVEIRDNPTLKGKAVIVGGHKGKRGVVTSGSYEARKFGIKAGIPIAEASKLCPQGIFIPVRMSRYITASEQIMSIFDDYSPLVEPLSLDEAFLDLTGTERLFGPPQEIARTIQQRIQNEVQLTASVGLARTKMLAKIASDLKKPNGFVVIPPDKEWEILKELPVKVLWGVGKVTNERLAQMGIQTVGQLASYPIEMMNQLFGKSGAHLWALAHCEDDREVHPYTPPKSFGNEITFEYNQTDPVTIRSILLGLCEKVGCRMRRHGYQGKTITLKVRYSDFQTTTHCLSLSEPTDQSGVIYPIILQLWSQLVPNVHPIRLLGVSVSNLDEDTEQLNLFSERNEKQERLTSAIDQINEKFQGTAVTRARLKLRSSKNPGSIYK